MPYDFFAPFVRVALTKDDGSRLPLWFGASSLVDADEFLYAQVPNSGGLGTNLAIVSGVEIEQSLGNFFTIKVTCSPTFPDAMALLESDAIVIGDTTLELQYGYIAGGGTLLTRTFVGLLTDPEFSLGEEITVTLSAQATCSTGMLRSASAEVRQGTRRKLIEDTALGSGEPLRNVVMNFEGVTGEAELRALNEEISYSPAGRNDNLVLRDLVEQCMCEVYYRPLASNPRVPEMVVIGRELRFGGTATKEFKLYSFGDRQNQTNRSLGGDALAGGVYPILDVSTTSKQVFLRSVVSGTVRSNVDDTRENAPVPERTLAADSAGPTLSAEQSPGGLAQNAPVPSSATPGPPETGTGNALIQAGAGHDFPTQHASNREQENNSNINAGVILKVGSVGIPDLEPGTIVSVRGLGKRYSGKYSLTKVTHSFGDGGYTSSWEGIANAGQLYARSEALPTANRVQQPVVDTIGTILREANEDLEANQDPFFDVEVLNNG